MELEASIDEPRPSGDPARARRILEVNPIRIAYRLNYVANFYTGPIYKEIERSHGLSRPEYIVMFCLMLEPGLLARDIVAICGRPKNSISRAVNALLRRGHLVEDGPPSQGRGRPLRLSEAGEAIARAILPLFERREAAMLSPLTAEETETFDRLLAKLSIRSDGWDGSY